MTVKTRTSFDLEAFRRGYEEWDIDALLTLYADDVELIQIDPTSPERPRVRHGKEMYKGMFEHCASAASRRRWRTRLQESIAPPPPSPASSRAAARSSRTGFESRSLASSASGKSCQAIRSSKQSALRAPTTHAAWVGPNRPNRR